MQIEFTLNLGGVEFKITEEADSHAKFFEKVSFFSMLPKVGPNGEADLKFVHRTTKEGYDYYSLVSESAKKEYTFGQPQKEPGVLFGKGWQDLYEGNNGQAQSNAFGQQQQQQQQPAQNTFGQQPAQQQQQAPAQEQQAAPALTPSTTQPVNDASAPAQNDAAQTVLSQFGIM